MSLVTTSLVTMSMGDWLVPQQRGKSSEHQGPEDAFAGK